MEQEPYSIKKDTKNTIPFFPDHITTEAWVAFGFLVLIGIIGVIAVFSPLGLGEPADPMNTPAHVKPEWYFLGLYQLLKYVSKTAGALIPVIFLLIIFAWPFIERNKGATVKAQRIRAIVSVVGFSVLIALTVWGEFS